MNRNEAINKLAEAGRDAFGISPIELDGWKYDYDARHYWNPREMFITENDAFVTESLQSRIETLLGMKFETEEKLLETIGSVWGTDFHHRVLDIVKPLRIDSDAGPLDTLKRLVRPTTVTVNNHSDNVKFSTEDDKEGRVTVTIQDIPRPVPPQQRTYWGGVEPLCVGHIVQGGEVVTIHKDVTCIKYVEGLANYKTTNIEPHPFAKYTDEQREFLQAQVEAGVIKLC